MKRILWAILIGVLWVGGSWAGERSSFSFSGKGSGVADGSDPVTEEVVWACAITPDQLSGDVNNYTPTGIEAACALRIDGGGSSRNITGLGSGEEGKILTIHNIGSNDLVLKDASGSSSGSNQFILDADKTIVGDSSVTVRYDGTSGGWRLFSAGGAAPCAEDDTAACELAATRSTSDTNFTPTNIKSGVNILNVTGSFSGDGDITTGLTHHYKLDDTSGTSVTDSSGNGRTGTITGSANWVTNDGRIDGALFFDGATYITVSSPSLPTGDSTYGAWVRPDDSADTIFGARASTSGTVDELLIQVSNSFAVARFDADASGNQFDGVLNYQTGVWTHIAITRSGSTLRLYVNGARLFTSQLTASLGFGTCALLIGVNPGGTGCASSLAEHFFGYLDDVRIYSRALTEQDIAKLVAVRATAHSADITTGLTHWYQFESDATDSSGNGRDGTLVGSPTFDTGCVGNGIVLNGSSQWVEVASPALPTGDFTYAACIKPATTNTTIAAFAAQVSSGSTQAEIIMWRNSSPGLQVQINNSTAVFTNIDVGSGITENAWVHVGITRKSGFVTLWLNGEPIEANGAAATLDFGTCQLVIGMDPDGTGCNGTPSDWWNGMIDEFRIYNRALTMADMAALAEM